MSDQYMQVGNAVPVQLGTAIARVILALAASKTDPGVPRGHDVELLLNKAVMRLRATARNKRKATDGQLLLVPDAAEAEV